MTKRILSAAVAVIMVMALIPASVLAKAVPTPELSKDEPTAQVSWDFESDPVEAGWVFADADGDGFNWFRHVEADGDHYDPHGGDGVLASVSYDNDSYTALHPDNWAFTPALTPLRGAAVTIGFWYEGLDPSYPYEHFMVYAGNSRSIESMTAISEEITASDKYVEFTADLSDYDISGEPIFFAIRHFDSTDQFALQIDDVTVTGAELFLPDPIDEIDLTFDSPAWGYTPDYSVEAPADAPISVENVLWERVLPFNDPVAMAPEDVFDSEASGYRLSFEIVIQDGYSFAAEPVVKLNGDAELLSECSLAAAGSIVCVSELYHVVEPPAVGVVYVNGFDFPPEPGEAAADHLELTVPDGAVYTITSANWYDEDALAPFFGVFEDGGHYSVHVTVELPTGYSFAIERLPIYANGELSLVSGFVFNNGSSISFYTVPFVCGTDEPDPTDAPVEPTDAPVDPTDAPVEPTDAPVEPTAVPGLSDLDAALNVPGGAIHFENVASYDWIVVEEDGRVYAQSGNHNIASSVSSIEARVTLGEEGGVISFEFMACGESSAYGTVFDSCYFYVDGTNVFNKGNETDLGWQSYSYELGPGEHVLRWYYSKDSSVNSEPDCFRVDNVAIGGIVPPEPTAEPTAAPTAVPVDPDELDAALNVEGGTIHFVNDAVYPWTVVETEDRVYAVSGNAGVHESTSTITANVTVEGEGMMIRFDLIARGEGYDQTDWDTCRFFVDGEMVMKYGSHDEVWESFECALTPGEHELKWQYKKDHSTHPAGDYFAVDNVEIIEGTPFVPEEITAIAITGFSAPVWGWHPDYEVEVPEDAPYTVREVFWYYANPDDEDYGTLEPDEYFDSEYCTYEMIVRLDHAEGYVFADEVSVTINGLTTIVGAHDTALAGYYYVYTKEFEVSPNVVEPTAAPVEPTGPYWDFETNPETQGWEFVDQDGDGHNWEWLLDWYSEYSFHEGDGFITSYSYDNDSETALSPDNWAITPEFTVPEDGIFSLWAQGQDPDWPYEVFGVYLKTVDGNGDWVQIGEDQMTWYADLKYEFDISDHAGETVRMAIRHYHTYDMFELNVDFVMVTSGQITPPPELIELHEVYVNGYEAPIAGEYSGDHLDLEVPEDAHYHIVNEGLNTPCWWDNDPDVDDEFDGVFVLGNPYSVGLTVEAEEGYCFADDCVFYVNGNAELVDYTYSGVDEWDNTLGYVWTVPEEAVEDTPGVVLIRDVYVYGFEAPVAGELAAAHVNLSVPEDAHYYIVYAGWLDETDQQQLWHDDDVFTAGHVYSEGCQIWADDGCAFADDCVFHIEGADIDPEWSYVDPDIDWICYINTVPVECPGQQLAYGDADGDGDVDITDALLVMRYVQGLVQTENIHVEVCDVNLDGRITLIDALLVLRFALELIPGLPLV